MIRRLGFIAWGVWGVAAGASGWLGCNVDQNLGDRPHDAEAGASSGDGATGDAGAGESGSGSSSGGEGGGAPADFVAGVAWREISTTGPMIDAVWGSSGTDVWGVGDGENVAHFDGSQLTVFRPANLFAVPRLDAVWGTSPTSAWAVGGGFDTSSETAPGVVAHWNGSDWVAPASPFPAQALLLGVWAPTDGDVWTVGGDMTAASVSVGFHGTGSGWTQPLADQTYVYESIWGVDDGHMWIGAQNAILSFDGHAVAPVATGLSADVQVICGSSATDVWAFGSSGLAEHWDGHTWQATPMGEPINFHGAWVAATNDVYAVGDLSGDAAIAHWDGTAWTKGTKPGSDALYGVWGGATGVVAMGHHMVFFGQ